MRRILVPATLAAALTGAGAAQATGGIMGLSGGVNLWSHDPDGDILGMDVDDELDLDGDSNANLWLEWRHVVPVAPRLRLEHTGLEQDGEGAVADAGVEGDFDGDTETDIDLSHTDLTLYWTPFPLPWVDLDIGATGRYFDGSLTVESGDGADFDQSISGFLPMLYGRAGVDIPGTRVRLEGMLQDLSVGDHSITDTRLQVAYKWWYAGAMLGYRDLSVDLDEFDDDVTIDVSFSGPYAGAFLRF